MFAIIDIETTGGYAAANGITEIAIILHNGREIEGKYATLINPNQPIPTNKFQPIPANPSRSLQQAASAPSPSQFPTWPYIAVLG